MVERNEGMSNGERAFVTAVKKYCASHGIEVELKADGWLIAMKRGSHLGPTRFVGKLYV